MKKTTYIILIFILTFLPLIGWAEVGPNYIEQYGITWTFDKNLSEDGSGDTYQYGTFVNGDYWVVGPVTLTEISPLCVTSNGRVMHGSTINPPPGGAQGYDSLANGYTNSLNDASGGFPIVIDVNENIPIKSLVSTRSLDNPRGGSHPKLSDAAILTIVYSTPSPTAFRPPYSGGRNADTYAFDNSKPAEILWSDVNTNAIKDLTPPTRKAPETSFATYMALSEGHFERPWLIHQAGWAASAIQPTNNMRSYGRGHSRQSALAGLLLNIGHGEDKDVLLTRFLQYGIDIYGILHAGGTALWINDGGNGLGKKMAFVFVAKVLDKDDARQDIEDVLEEMQDLLSRSGSYRYTSKDGENIPYWPDRITPDYVHFGDDGQTHYVTQTDVDIMNNTDVYWDITRSNPAVVNLLDSSGTALANGNAVRFYRVEWPTGNEQWAYLLNYDAYRGNGGKEFVLRNYDSGNETYELEYGTGWGELKGDPVDTSGFDQAHPTGNTGNNGRIKKASYDLAYWDPDDRHTAPLRWAVSDIGTPEWTIRHAGGASDARGFNTQNKALTSNYRGITSPSIPGQILTARIMGMEDLWNHNAIFDYADRWISLITDADLSKEGSYWYGVDGIDVYSYTPDRLVRFMWETYRADYGTVWPDGASNPEPQPEPEPETNPDPELEDDAANDIPDKTLLRISNNIIKSGGNSAVTINCDVKEPGRLIVKIYDSKGKKIIILWDGFKEAGSHSFPWAGVDSGGSKVGSGIYMVHMESGSYSKTKKIAVIK